MTVCEVDITDALTRGLNNTKEALPGLQPFGWWLILEYRAKIVDLFCISQYMCPQLIN